MGSDRLTFWTFLGRNTVVTDSGTVANIHDTYDRLKSRGSIRSNDNRLIGRVVGNSGFKEYLEFTQIRRFSGEIEFAFVVNVDDNFAGLARHWHRACCCWEDNVETSFFLLKFAGNKKENEQQKHDVDEWCQAQCAGDAGAFNFGHI